MYMLSALLFFLIGGMEAMALRAQLALPNLTVLRHDVLTDDFPGGSFDLVHIRAVLMHIPGRMATLQRMASWSQSSTRSSRHMLPWCGMWAAIQSWSRIKS